MIWPTKPSYSVLNDLYILELRKNSSLGFYSLSSKLINYKKHSFAMQTAHWFAEFWKADSWFLYFDSKIIYTSIPYYPNPLSKTKFSMFYETLPSARQPQCLELVLPMDPHEYMNSTKGI